MPNYDALVGSIYDCAANPELWPEVLTTIRDEVGGAYALVGYIDQSEMASGRPPFAVRHNSPWDEEWLIKLESMLKIMPQGGGLLNSLPQGGGLADGNVDIAWTQLTRSSEADFHASDFYNHWVKPQGLRDTINTPYVHRVTMTGMLSIPSFATREPYGADECHLIERLTPHVRRAMLISDITDKGKLALTLYQQVLDSLAAAVFIVGEGQRMVFTNAAGDKMLSDGSLLALEDGALQPCQTIGSSTALADAVGRACYGDMSIGIAGIGVPLRGATGERAAAYVLPISGNDVRRDLGRGKCIVFVARRGEQQPMTTEILRTLFNLTQAEARIAQMVALGDGPQVIADALGLSINTVRTHLKHCYAKTAQLDLTGLSGLVNGLMPPIAKI